MFAYFWARMDLMGLTEGADRAMYNARALKFDYV